MSYLAIVGCVVLVVAGSAQGADRPSPEHGGMGGPVVPPHKIVFAHLFTSPCDYVPFCAQLDYHGGPVMHQTTTYAIFWLPTGLHVGRRHEPV